MKHKVTLLVLALWLALAAVLPQTAQAASTLLAGQKHYYSVQLRSDEQAVVYGKIIFEAGDTEQNKLELKLPEGVSAANLSAQQILAKSTNKTCVVYETYQDWRSRQTTSTPSTTGASPLYEQTKRCITYDDSTYDEDYDYDKNMSSGNDDYYSLSYYTTRSTDYEYKDIEIKQNGQALSFELPTAVKAHKQGSILVSFTSSDFVSGNLGYFTYAFRTLIANQMIDNSTVAINFDDDLYSSQSTQTRTSEVSKSSNDLAGGANSAKSGYQSSSTDDTQLGVGRAGRYIQTQGKMLPGDTLEVKGTYATKPILLYGKQIIIGLVLLFGAIVATLWYRRYRKAHPRPVSSSSSDAPIKTSWWRASLPANPGMLSVGQMVSSSAVSVLATAVGIWVVSVLFLSNTENYSSNSMVDYLYPVLYAVCLVSIALFGLVIIPGLNALKHGVGQAHIWALLHVITIVGISLILWALLMGISSGGDSVSPGYDGCINC
jgi:hypothetical protein